IDPAELIEFARSRLSAYKCPQHVVCVDELPLTANGKIRKQTLRELWSARQAPTRPAYRDAARAIDFATAAQAVDRMSARLDVLGLRPRERILIVAEN